MNINEQYDQWSETYDSQENKTRDLELISQTELLKDYHFKNALEIGCGTGKNTGFLLTKSTNLTSIDFSEKMIEIAKTKFASTQTNFQIVDITKLWPFQSSQFDLISESLVLEHINDLDFVFRQAFNTLKPEGVFYISELHPFKQYTGSKARIQTEKGETLITCFTHHISDFITAAQKAGFKIITIKEFFDNNDRASFPRIISIILKK